MEGLIFALVVMALGAFFNKKKNDGEDAPSERTSSAAGPNQPAPRRTAQSTFKRAEDYAKEIYGEFQSQMNKQEQPQRMQQAAEKAEKAVKKAPIPKSRPDVADSKPSGRLSAHQRQAPDRSRKKADVKEELFPLTHNDAQKGIILAEIFMAPKAKR